MHTVWPCSTATRLSRAHRERPLITARLQTPEGFSTTLDLAFSAI